jgi:hypothetical protein
MNQEEFDREFVELKERLGIVMDFLQESDEHQRRGWNVKKKLKCPIVQFFVRELR